MRRTAGVWKSLGVAAVLWPAGIEHTFAQTAAPDAPVELPAVDVVATSPLPGGGKIVTTFQPWCKPCQRKILPGQTHKISPTLCSSRFRPLYRST